VHHNREALAADNKMMHKIIDTLTKNLNLADHKARSVTQQWQSDKATLKDSLKVKTIENDELMAKVGMLESKFRAQEQVHRDRHMVAITKGGSAGANKAFNADDDDERDMTEADILRAALIESEQELNAKRDGWMATSQELAAANIELFNAHAHIETITSEVEVCGYCESEV
jgi:hypothetical protein